MKARALALAAGLLVSWAADAYPYPRSSSVRAEFRKANPCPATGKKTGACPGWQIDHMHALCAGGVDEPGNLNWIKVEDHKRKTRQDVRECRKRRS